MCTGRPGIRNVEGLTWASGMAIGSGANEEKEMLHERRKKCLQSDKLLAANALCEGFSEEEKRKTGRGREGERQIPYAWGPSWSLLENHGFQHLATGSGGALPFRIASNVNLQSPVVASWTALITSNRVFWCLPRTVHKVPRGAKHPPLSWLEPLQSNPRAHTHTRKQ